MGKSGLLDFNKVREATSFEAVLDWYDLAPEKPGDKQVKINCPFHDDSTPSCSISLEKGQFNCFGCSAKGNVLDFIGEMEDNEGGVFGAAKVALEIIGGDAKDFRKDENGDQKPQKGRRGGQQAKPARSSADKPKKREAAPQPASEAEETETTVSQNPVKDIKLTLDYEHPFLTSRNVSPALAGHFGMGFCNKGIMRGRIAIPMHNAEGEPIGFLGRWAEEGPLPDKEAKYKLPKGFQKSLELFNLHRAAALANNTGKKYVTVVEGVWSVTRLHEAGVPVVALLGTSCCETQAAKLAAAGFRYAVVILDGDDAGREATPKVVHVLSQHVYVKTVVLPEGTKPDTMDEDLVSELAR